MIGRSALLAAFVAGCGVSHTGGGEQGEGADAATDDGARGAGTADAGSSR